LREQGKKHYKKSSVDKVAGETAGEEEDDKEEPHQKSIGVSLAEEKEGEDNIDFDKDVDDGGNVTECSHYVLT
jgi:hypothetical protein